MHRDNHVLGQNTRDGFSYLRTRVLAQPISNAVRDSLYDNILSFQNDERVALQKGQACRPLRQYTHSTCSYKETNFLALRGTMVKLVDTLIKTRHRYRTAPPPPLPAPRSSGRKKHKFLAWLTTPATTSICSRSRQEPQLARARHRCVNELVRSAPRVRLTVFVFLPFILTQSPTKTCVIFYINNVSPITSYMGTFAASAGQYILYISKLSFQFDKHVARQNDKRVVPSANNTRSLRSYRKTSLWFEVLYSNSPHRHGRCPVPSRILCAS